MSLFCGSERFFCTLFIVIVYSPLAQVCNHNEIVFKVAWELTVPCSLVTVNALIAV